MAKRVWKQEEKLRFFIQFNVDKDSVVMGLIGYFLIGQYFLLPILNLLFSFNFMGNLEVLASGIAGILFAIILGRISYISKHRYKKTKKRIP
jgi:hypothetical protein